MEGNKPCWAECVQDHHWRHVQTKKECACEQLAYDYRYTAMCGMLKAYFGCEWRHPRFRNIFVLHSININEKTKTHTKVQPRLTYRTLRTFRTILASSTNMRGIILAASQPYAHHLPSCNPFECQPYAIGVAHIQAILYAILSHPCFTLHSFCLTKPDMDMSVAIISHRIRIRIRPTQKLYGFNGQDMQIIVR